MTLTPALWTEIQARLRTEAGDTPFESWLKPLSPGDAANGKLILFVPTQFMLNWVVRNFTTLVERVVTDVLGGPHQVEYVVRAVETPKPKMPEPKPAAKAPAPLPVTAPMTETFVRSPIGRSLDDAGNALNPTYTFDNFVTGKSNEFAYAAARRIAESADGAFNPFFLWGGVGLGKTHLMHAIAWHIREKTSSRKVLYISSETFVNHFIRSLKDKTTLDFKSAFRSVDVLMIDDIQFIAGKETSQEEFFHTFNALVSERKQVILTADRSPLEMDNLEDRLRSRLGGGLTTEVHKPDLETRLAILDRKASNMGIELGRDVSQLLANRILSNVRELEGALNRLIAHATLVNRPITVDSAQDILRDLFQSNARLLTLDEIQQKVADYYRIKLSDMHSARRSRDVARPRQVAMYLSKSLTTRSFPDIGKAFGGRDHTTVMHAVKTIDDLKTNDPQLREDLSILEKVLSGSR
jgi:chromosomal replication initiator protein